MNARWAILLVVCMAVVLAAQVGIAAPAAPPASSHNQTRQTQATTVRATLVSAPCPPLPPCPRPQACLCYVQPPCGNVAPWSWQHDNQNDNQWPADHGG